MVGWSVTNILPAKKKWERREQIGWLKLWIISESIYCFLNWLSAFTLSVNNVLPLLEYDNQYDASTFYHILIFLMLKVIDVYTILNFLKYFSAYYSIDFKYFFYLLLIYNLIISRKKNWMQIISINTITVMLTSLNFSNKSINNATQKQNSIILIHMGCIWWW